MLQPAADYPFRRDVIEAVPVVSDGMGGEVPLGLREIVRILRRRLRIIVLTTLALSATAVLFLLLVTPRYTATAVS